ncbi:uroporphyrinogen-III C-methyltransferase [Salininema proteolyticum]|uniref:Uroporphyrinogen-III C-methyltransferase n=1 Tax=Salininema proteolyticum TaxID=1607685 RepID=A0ABV8TTH4_9ACTN
MSILPIGLNLESKPVTVIGAGAVAARRVMKLAAAGAVVTVVAPEATTAVETMAARGEVAWERREWSDGDLEGAWFAVAATDSPEVNAAVAEEAERRRVWCVRSDAGDESGAWMSASVTVGDVTVGVNATRNPKRAMAVRDEVERVLEAGAVALGPEKRRGQVTLVGSGPGHPGLITVAGLAALRQAEVVVTDHLVPQELLAELSGDVELIDAAKIPYGRQTGQDEINRLLVEHAQKGKAVVRLKGGDGFVFGRGAEEMDACAAEQIPVRVVPGVSSSLAGPVSAGVSVTERGVVHDFTVISGHVPPGHPNGLTDWRSVAGLTGTLVLLMAVKNRAAIAEALMEHGKAGDTPVRVVENATTPRQTELSTTLERLGDEEVSSPAVIVVGPVAGRARELPSIG